MRYSCTRTKDIDFSALWAVQFDKLHKNRSKRLATGPGPWYHGTHRETFVHKGETPMAERRFLLVDEMLTRLSHQPCVVEIHRGA